MAPLPAPAAPPTSSPETMSSAPAASAPPAKPQTEAGAAVQSVPAPEARPAPAPADAGIAVGSSTFLGGPMGSAALFAEYQHCLSKLEGMINGGLSRKRAALLECAAAVERNMSEVRHATDAVQREADDEAAGVAERLHAASKQRLSILQSDLSAYLVDVQAIDVFIRGVLSSVSEPPPHVSAAQHAQQLLEREHELMGKAQRLAIKPHAPPTPVRSDDLPREVAERHAQREHAEQLEAQLRQKDEQIATLEEEVKLSGQAQQEAAGYAERAHAYAQAVQNGSHSELLEWASVAEASARRIDALDAERRATRHEAEELRGQNDALRAQNDQLREHCEELRRLLVRHAGSSDAAMLVPGPIATA